MNLNIFSLFDLALIIQMFVLLDPLTAAPVLMSAYKNKMNIRNIAVSAVLLAFAIAVLVALFGVYLFNLFGIGLDSFRIAGGIVLLLLGLDTIRSKQEEDGKNVKKTDAIVSIIATPLLTGPAIISFITIKTFEIGQTAVVFNVFFAFILVAIVFMLFTFFISKINPKLIDIVSRVLGLFLTAVAIELIAKGIHGLFG